MCPFPPERGERMKNTWQKQLADLPEACADPLEPDLGIGILRVLPVNRSKRSDSRYVSIALLQTQAFDIEFNSADALALLWAHINLRAHETTGHEMATSKNKNVVIMRTSAIGIVRNSWSEILQTIENTTKMEAAK